MSFPLILSKDELIMLRVMAHITASTRIMEVATGYRATVLASSNLGPDAAAREDEIFVGRIGTWLKTRTDLDMPLLIALLKMKGGTTGIVNLEKNEFETLKAIANFKYGSGEDEATQKIADRLQVLQPAIKAAFEVAEANEKATALPTMPEAGGVN